MIDFLFQKYTDVSWWQIAGGWTLALFLGLTSMMFERLYRSQRGYTKYWFKEWCDKGATAIDKVKSLEAQIARLTVRPRGKDGKFQKKQG